MYNVIKLNNYDNVGIAPMPIPKVANINSSLTARNNIPYGHKISLVKIEKIALFTDMGKL